MCSTISLKSCNLAQILQSPKSEIVTCVMFSTHTNTSLIKPHLTELAEIHRNWSKSNYFLHKSCNLAQIVQSQRYIRQTEIHTFFIWNPRVGREHNLRAITGGLIFPPPLKEKIGQFPEILRKGVFILPKIFRILKKGVFILPKISGFFTRFDPIFEGFPAL